MRGTWTKEVVMLGLSVEWIKLLIGSRLSLVGSVAGVGHEETLGGRRTCMPCSHL